MRVGLMNGHGVSAMTIIQAALDGYLRESTVLALDLVVVLEHSFRRIQEFPATGSPRYAHELSIPDSTFEAVSAN